MWPTESFDYYPIMVGFGVVTAVVSASLAVHRWRAHAVRAMVVLAAVWCAWALDFYMVDVSRHWSQRTLFERYYACVSRAPTSLGAATTRATRTTSAAPT